MRFGNPIAAMRLKAENAVAAGPDVARKDNALKVIVEQIGRLETLLRNLLSSVQRAPLVSAPVKDVVAFLAERVELFREQAALLGGELEARGDLRRRALRPHTDRASDRQSDPECPPEYAGLAVA